MLVQRENVQLTIKPEKLKKYLSQGFKEVKIGKKEIKANKETETEVETDVETEVEVEKPVEKKNK